MSVIRVNKTRDYTVMSNYHFRDKRLSLKAKGLLSQMLSLPPEWDYTIAGLAAINKENESAIVSALRELKAAGYLVVTKRLPNETESGRIEYEYDVYEQPREQYENGKQEGKKQGVENQGLEFQGIENQGQYNTDISNTKDKIKTKNSIRGKDEKKSFCKPTPEEVRAYCAERKNRVDPERWYNHYESVGWKVGRNPMKDWKAAVRTWERSPYESPPKPIKPRDDSLDDIF